MSSDITIPAPKVINTRKAGEPHHGFKIVELPYSLKEMKQKRVAGLAIQICEYELPNRKTITANNRKTYKAIGRSIMAKYRLIPRCLSLFDWAPKPSGAYNIKTFGSEKFVRSEVVDLIDRGDVDSIFVFKNKTSSITFRQYLEHVLLNTPYPDPPVGIKYAILRTKNGIKRRVEKGLSNNLYRKPKDIVFDLNRTYKRTVKLHVRLAWVSNIVLDQEGDGVTGYDLGDTIDYTIEWSIAANREGEISCRWYPRYQLRGWHS